MMIDVQAVSKYFGEFCAVDQVSFSVPEGKIFGFLGPNGAGKTTMIKMLTALMTPTRGTLHVNGHDTVRESSAVRRAFGIVFQDPSLDDELTAFENMELHGVLFGVPSRELPARMEKLLRLVELWDRRTDIVKHFSGGMKRRLEIARALLHEPRVIFLDEPTLGLDPQTRNHIWTYIKDISRDRKVTVFFTTHYMDEADRVADEIAIIDNGKIVANGSPEALKVQTQKASLEEAFIALTGHAIRDQDASPVDQLRMRGRLWGRR